MGTYDGGSRSPSGPAVRGRKGFHKEIFAQAAKAGLTQVRVDGDVVALAERPALDRYREHDIDFVIGSVLVSRRASGRYRPCWSRPCTIGQGACSVVAPAHD